MRVSYTPKTASRSREAFAELEQKHRGRANPCWPCTRAINARAKLAAEWRLKSSPTPPGRGPGRPGISIEHDKAILEGVRAGVPDKQDRHPAGSTTLAGPRPGQSPRARTRHRWAPRTHEAAQRTEVAGCHWRGRWGSRTGLCGSARGPWPGALAWGDST